MSSYSVTTTFTRTHAREIASRVAADLRLMNRYYDAPSLASIDDYETEFVELLVGGYLDQVEYGFKRSGERVYPVEQVGVRGHAAGLNISRAAEVPPAP